MNELIPSQSELAGFYRDADVALVTPLRYHLWQWHAVFLCNMVDGYLAVFINSSNLFLQLRDGMNLVAKEFVACRFSTLTTVGNENFYHV